METILNWLRGSVTAVITGAETERFLNLCAQAALPVWEVERVDAFTLSVTTTRRGGKTLCRLAEQAQCTVKLGAKKGVPFFLLRFRRRYALVAGALLCLVLLAVGSRLILVIDVEGNQTVPTAEILSQLRLHGVTVGTYGPGLDTRVLSHEMLLSMHRLTFFSLNLHGTRAEVVVHEADPHPKVVDRTQPTNVVSSATGIVTHMEPWAGDPLFQEGETVCRGEVLITGTMDIEEPEYSEIDLGILLVHAQGRVLARTWHTMTAEIPLTASVKTYTGQETTRRSVSLLGKWMKFYTNSRIPYENYDTIIKEKSWTPVPGKMLPVTGRRETLRAYTLTETKLDQDKAEELLRRRLLETLEGSMDEGKVLKTDYTAQIQGDFLTVTLLAECTEQIGREVPLNIPERALGPKHSYLGGAPLPGGPEGDTDSNTKEQGQ